MVRVRSETMLSLHRAAAISVALAAALAGVWLLGVAVPELIDRHRDGALVEAVFLLAAVPAGLVWGAIRLVHMLRDFDDDR